VARRGVSELAGLLGVKTTVDGTLVEFASVVDAVRCGAVRCAVAVQQTMPERATGASADNRIELRIGINLEDVIVEEDDLYGDGVNIVARIETLAEPGKNFVWLTRDLSGFCSA
jgi:class 3 adenylate cyclase